MEAGERVHRRPDGGSFFCLDHLFDPHTPYDPPEPFHTRFKDHPYDGEIAYVDAILSEVIAELTSRSLLEKTVIVVVSNHGEGLGEHDEDEHGLLAYDSTLHVPWIIRLPNRLFQGTTVEQPVSLVDVMPTVLDLTGDSVPADIDGEAACSSCGREPPSAPMHSMPKHSILVYSLDGASWLVCELSGLSSFADNVPSCTTTARIPARRATCIEVRADVATRLSRDRHAYGSAVHFVAASWRERRRQGPAKGARLFSGSPPPTPSDPWPTRVTRLNRSEPWRTHGSCSRRIAMPKASAHCNNLSYPTLL